MRTRRKGRRWWMVACGLMAMAIARTASASEVDVCVHVLEDFTNISHEYRCGSLLQFPPNPLCLFNPLCCTPIVCKVTPVCGIAKTIEDTLQAGDVHCFKGISAETLWQRWKDRQLAFGIEIVTDLVPCAANLLLCGVPEALLLLAQADIALIAAEGSSLPPNLQELLKEIIAPIYDNGNTGFGYDDISNIKIISQSHNSLTKIWLSDPGVRGMTLGPVVILRDYIYNQLTNPANKYTLTDLLIGKGSQGYDIAVSVIIHELVHVKQYRVLGQETFFLNYLLRNAPRITEGYGHDPYEREAFNFTADIIERHGGVLCMQTADELNGFIRQYNLGRKNVQCRPYVPWMIGLILAD